MSSIKCIGVLAHPLRSNSYEVARTIANSLKEHGVGCWLYTQWDAADVRESVQGADMVVAIGGDGAMLKAARVCAPYGVPVLGVNLGRLGFLTEIARPENWESHLDRVLAGHYWIEDRMMIKATVLRDGVPIASGEALNDVVISGNVLGRMIQVDTYIDSDWATTYSADALIISTPTGSTAYALAVGGPILPPDLHNILIVPSAPHLSMDRPIVLSQGATVDVKASTRNQTEVILTVDGVILFQLQPADQVRVQSNEHKSRFVRLRERNYFYRSLLDRLEPRVNRHEPDDIELYRNESEQE